ncbi:S41 family peptidase [Kitasatospora sp. NPDC101183]|uniref:S41 family peptidase n=1 Tax=Kitasatospora sp. NPDC101183 TaxID=3364100 RepID=UPI003815FB64
MTHGSISRAVATAVATAALATTVAAVAPGVATAQAGKGRSLEGVWRMDGYGTVVTIAGGKLTTYDETTHSCVPGGITITQAGPPGPDGTVRFMLGHTGLSLTPKGRDQAIEREDGGIDSKTLNRIDALPALCTLPAPNDPLSVFDRFWEDFEENYPFFAAKGIDWHAVRDEQRQKITPTTTTDRLQEILIDTLRPLGDGHTALARFVNGAPKEVFGGERPDTLPRTKELIDRAGKAVAAQLTGPEQVFAGGKLGVGRLPDGVGYLRVSGFSRYTDGDYASQAAELDRALDALLADPDALSGLVIDIRLNSGGSDGLGLQIASRLTDCPYLAYRKVARNDPADPTKFTRPQPITVRPSAGEHGEHGKHGEHFTGPVTLLTSSISASAAETFTQALMGRSPHVTRIGDNTQGVFSDVLRKMLSPDFAVLLPNEKYLTREGTTFDGPGIAPDVRTPVFSTEELAALKDSALSTARRILAEDER